MAFERFEKVGRSYLPKVSIWSRGQIGFSMGAIKKFGLNKFKFVIFFFDKTTNCVGFKFTNDENEKGIMALKVRKTGAMVGAKGFLDYYAVNYGETRQYELRHDTRDDMYVIDLKKSETKNE